MARRAVTRAAGPGATVEPGSDFPTILPGLFFRPGRKSYASFQLKPNTVYYLLPGVHIGNLQADENDAFVGGLSNGQPTVLSGDYAQSLLWAIETNSSIGNQAGVTIEYLTIEKYMLAATRVPSTPIPIPAGLSGTTRSPLTYPAPGWSWVLTMSQRQLHDLESTSGFQSVAANTWGWTG